MEGKDNDVCMVRDRSQLVSGIMPPCGRSRDRSEGPLRGARRRGGFLADWHLVGAPEMSQFGSLRGHRGLCTKRTVRGMNKPAVKEVSHAPQHYTRTHFLATLFSVVLHSWCVHLVVQVVLLHVLLLYFAINTNQLSYEQVDLGL